MLTNNQRHFRPQPLLLSAGGNMALYRGSMQPRRSVHLTTQEQRERGVPIYLLQHSHKGGNTFHQILPPKFYHLNIWGFWGTFIQIISDYNNYEIFYAGPMVTSKEKSCNGNTKEKNQSIHNKKIKSQIQFKREKKVRKQSINEKFNCYCLNRKFFHLLQHR